MRLLWKLPKRHSRGPHILISDKLGNCDVVRHTLIPDLGRGLSTRAENSRQPMLRERQMKRFNRARILGMEAEADAAALVA